MEVNLPKFDLDFPFFSRLTQAGAKHVYAVDMSDIVDTAREIVRANGLSDVITVIKGLPPPPFFFSSSTANLYRRAKWALFIDAVCGMRRLMRSSRSTSVRRENSGVNSTFKP